MRGSRHARRRARPWHGRARGRHGTASVEHRIARLEAYQRDHEEEAADVAETIKRLRDRAATRPPVPETDS